MPSKILPGLIPPSNIIPPNPNYTYFETAQDNPFRPDAVNAAWLADTSLLAYGLGDAEYIPKRIEDAQLPVAVASFDKGGTGCFIH